MNYTKLSKLLALASSDTDAEALSALRKAKALLSADGLDFKDVAERMIEPAAPTVQTGQKKSGQHPAPPSFDDFMEAKEPGWKAKQAEARAERKRKEAEERAAVIAKYGSEEAATAPCERERALNDATAHLRRKERKNGLGGANWKQDTLDGWSRFGAVMSPALVEAITNALPMPGTVREAGAECEYWRARQREIDAVHGFIGVELGLAAEARWKVIRGLFEHELPIRTLDDLHVRLTFAAESEDNPDPETIVSILDGFERLVIGTDATASPVHSGHPARASDRRAAVLDMLSNADTAGWSDRAIARACGVSPTTVGALRRKAAA